MSVPSSIGEQGVDPLAIRPPLQRRSREAWRRVLDAGVTLLVEGGYEAFTIGAVCERASVAPRALYDRADTKDALFLAVYEHGMARVRVEHAVFADDSYWDGRSAADVARQAVHELAGIFHRHAGFLGAVVLVSGAHPEVFRRGAGYAQELGDAFTGRLLQHRQQLHRPDAETAVRTAFTAVFSALVLRVAYGPAFATPATDDAVFAADFGELVQRAVLAAPPSP